MTLLTTHHIVDAPLRLILGYCLINIRCHRPLYGELCGHFECILAWMRLIPLVKLSPVRFFHGSLSLWNPKYLAIGFMSPAKLLFTSQYLHATAHYNSIIFLLLQFWVKQYKEPGEYILTHSVLQSLVSLTPPCVDWSDQHHQFLSLDHWPPYWPNQSVIIRCATLNLVLEAFWILDAIVKLSIGFVICLPFIFTHIWIIQVTVPVQPIFFARNAFRCTMLITFSCMAVNSLVLADI